MRKTVQQKSSGITLKDKKEIQDVFKSVMDNSKKRKAEEDNSESPKKKHKIDDLGEDDYSPSDDDSEDDESGMPQERKKKSATKKRESELKIRALEPQDITRFKKDTYTTENKEKREYRVVLWNSKWYISKKEFKTLTKKRISVDNIEKHYSMDEIVLDSHVLRYKDKIHGPGYLLFSINILPKCVNPEFTEAVEIMKDIRETMKNQI